MRIVGFGACLINGYPLDKNESFFSKFVKLLNSNNVTVDFSETVSLGGFPITRAEKYTEKKVLALNPDLVVIQFGTTDISINFKSSFNKLFNKEVFPANTNDLLKSEAATSLNAFSADYGTIFKKNIKYFVKFLLSKFMFMKCITPLDKYIESMEHIIKVLLDKSIDVIVLSPFAQADFYANIRARKYLNALMELNKKYNFLLIDCCTPLKKYKHSIFFYDGTHFTSLGHDIVAEKIYDSYINGADDSPIYSNGIFKYCFQQPED